MTNEERAMRRSGISVAIIGLIFAIVSIPQLHFLMWPFLQLAYWPLAEVPHELMVPTGVMVAITGGLTVGMGMMLWAIATYIMPVAAEAGRKVVRTSAWSWFAVDSTFSILTGAPFNAVLNIAFLALMLLCLNRKGAAFEQSAST